jgi:putative membrane protein
VALALGAGQAAAKEQQQQKKTGQQKVKDPNAERVLQQIHEINMAEVEVGRLAQEKGQSDDVRNLGKEIEKDHQDADKQVMDLAKKKGFNLQSSGMQMDQHGEVVEHLSTVQPKQFDQQFLSAMIDGHGDAIKELSNAPMQIQDKDTKDLINEILPEMLDHYEKASTTLARLGTEQGQQPRGQQQQQQPGQQRR